MAELLFHRGGGWQDGMRAYKVLIDGKECATIKQNSEVRVPVAPGRQNVQLRIAWCSSPSLEIAVKKDGIEVIECGPNSNPFLALIYVIFFRKKYIWIKQKADNL
jgi:hypothetical protein